MGDLLGTIFLLILIVAVVRYLFKPRTENTNTVNKPLTSSRYREIEQLSKLNFLLNELAAWREEGSLDPATAQMLINRYESRKRALLGLEPHTLEVKTSPAPETALDISQRTEPQEIPLPKPKPVRSKPKFNLLNFLQEKNIKWFNALGTLMLVAAGIIFVATNWESWSGGVKSLIMVLVTAFFFLSGYFIKNKLDLPNSGMAFYLVGSLFIPLSLVSFNNFAVFGRGFDWAAYLALTSLVCLGFYSFMTYTLKSQIFAGLSALTGGAGLFALLTYLDLSYDRAGIFFIPLSLLYFLAYYLITKRAGDYRPVLLPVVIGANVMAAVGLGLSAVDRGLALFTTAIIASVSYLISTYLFKRLEYLYVCVGVLVLSVFPGVGYFHLPGRAYNLSFVGIAGVTLFLSYLNRRLNNRQFEKHFFYAMLGATVLAGFFVINTQISLFSTPLKYNRELGGSILTLLAGSLVYFLSAQFYQSKRFTYVGVSSFAAGYTLALMWLGINGKLYAVFFLCLAAVLVALGKFLKAREVFGRPLYLAGMVANGLVTLLLMMLLSGNSQIFKEFDTNLLAGIIAIVLNASLYIYLSHDNKQNYYAWAGNVLFSSAYIMFAVYLGLTRWQFGLYAFGLVCIFLATERLLKPWGHFYVPAKYCTIASNLLFSLLWLALIFSNLNVLGKFAGNLVLVLLAFALNSLVYLYLAHITKLPYYTYGATSLTYFIVVLFLNWFGLAMIYIFSTPMLLVGFYLFLERLVKLPEPFSEPLHYSAIAANILTTCLLFLFADKLNWVQYTFLTLGLVSNAAAYFYLAWQHKSQWFTWGGLVPAALTYIHFIRYFKIDPWLNYLGLEIMLFALVLVGLGALLVKKGLKFYYQPLLILGYGASVLGVAAGFTNGENLLYPAFLATLLYSVTAYLSPIYREWFWRGALSAANITFGAVLYKLNPHYSLVTYVKYFIVFNLLKFGLGFYLQYFENNLKFAWSNYGGVILTSLASLGITVLSRDFAAASLVWLVYGLLYFALAYLLRQRIATYLSTVVISLGFCYLLRYLGVIPSQLGLYLAGLSFVWIGLGVLLKEYEVYAVPLKYIVPAAIALPFAFNLASGLNSTILGAVIATAALLVQGQLTGTKLYYYLAPLVLTAGYEGFLLKYHVRFPEAYLAPISLYLIVVSFFLRVYNWSLNYLGYLGLLIFMGTSYLNSFTGKNFLVHALLLGITAMGSILLGAALKHRGFFFLGIIFLLGDVSTQSRSFLFGLQKWFWIGLGGSMFLALGLLFDKKRKDNTLEMVNRQVERFKGWS